MMQTLEFLSQLYSDCRNGHLVLWSRQDRRALWLPTSDIDGMGSRAEELATACDVYFGVALQDKEAAFAKWRKDNPHVPGAPTTRGCSETAKALPGLWVDVDVQGPAHKATNLPPSKAAALGLIQKFPFPPTIVVNSGHGLQAYWLFRELWTFAGKEERQAAQMLARRFLVTLQANARVHRWQLDPTSDLARVMRLPGTWNRKLQPLPVRVIEHNEPCRYNPSDLEPYLMEIPQTEDDTGRQWHGPAGTVEPVLQRCQFIQHCRGDAATLSEPEWYAMVSNLARLDGGREAIHSLSVPYPRYSSAETEQKIQHALTGSGPHTCHHIQYSLAFTGCPPSGCGVKAPAALGLSRHDTRTAHARRLRQEAEETARRILAKRRGEAA